jgi:hypothetical protein
MTALPAKHQKLQAAMKNGLMNFISATKATKPYLRLVPPAPEPMSTAQMVPAPQLDLIELTVLAVNRLGPATFRTATIGKAATVSVPDARTAEIFRAALREMQKYRRTDRLIDVVVAAEDGPRRGPASEAPMLPKLETKGAESALFVRHWLRHPLQSDGSEIAGVRLQFPPVQIWRYRRRRGVA